MGISQAFPPGPCKKTQTHSAQYSALAETGTTAQHDYDLKSTAKIFYYSSSCPPTLYENALLQCECCVDYSCSKSFLSR